MILLIASSVILFKLYTNIPVIKSEITNNMKDDSLHTINMIMQNFERHLRQTLDEHPGESLESLFRKGPLLRERFESQLNMIESNDMKYAFMLYRDDNRKFRFLLDGASGKKVPLGRKFDTPYEEWHRAYERQNAELIEQNNLSGLWLTYLYPVVYDGTTQGVVAIDLSLEHHASHTAAIEPLERTLIIVLGLIFLIVLVTFAQYLLYFFTHRRVYVDALTQVPNRQFLNDLLPTMTFQKYHIVMLDIDRFKNINDAYGHSMGDHILKRVAQTLKDGLRDEDIFARYGGEEFILFIQSNRVDEPMAKRILERLRKSIESLAFSADGITIKTTISIGANLDAKKFKNVHDAIKKADERLYRAKQLGRNRVCTFPEQDENGDVESTRLNLHQVKEAMEEQRLIFHYQPIINFNTARVEKFETLVRIEQNDGTIAYPISFLPHIANSQVYKEMTMRLIKHNCELAKATGIALSLNLNITDLLDDDIFELALSLFTQHEGLAGLMTFELLEEEKINDIELLKERISVLHRYGASMAIDDFGTGYSNFSHLLQLDIDIIKIDGSLIKEIDHSNTSLQLVEAIVAFAHASDKTVIAEFVHNESVMEIVKRLGITYGQGFYLGKPSARLSR